MHSVREEVGIDQDAVGWAEGGVGLEEERGGDLWDFAFGLFGGEFLFRFEVAGVLVLLSVDSLVSRRQAKWRWRRVQSRILLSYDPLHLRELARLLLDTHDFDVVQWLCVVLPSITSLTFWWSAKRQLPRVRLSRGTAARSRLERGMLAVPSPTRH